MGGVAGHLSHLQENLDFTFGDLKSILQSVSTGETPAIEKVDGQNIFFKFFIDPDTGNIRTARNAGDVKKGGMTPAEYASKWEGHPAGEGFVAGFEAIDRALGRVGSDTLTKIFEAGDNQRFVNAEIIYTGNPNVINYGADYIVLHNLQEFDPTGKMVDVQLQGGEFNELVNAIDDSQQGLDQETWQVVGPQIAKLKDMAGTDVLEKFTGEIDALGVTDGQTLAEYVEEKLRTGSIGNLPIPVNKQEDLIRRIIGIGRGLDPKELPQIGDIKKGIPKDVQKQISAIGTQTNAKKTIATMLVPVEKAIHNMAVEVLRDLESALVADTGVEIERLKGELQAAREKIESATDAGADARREMLAKQLDKLGSSENIASTLEGIVFEQPPGSKALYKLTGAFAPLNQIVGRAARIPTGQNEALLRTYVRMAILAG